MRSAIGWCARSALSALRICKPAEKFAASGAEMALYRIPRQYRDERRAAKNFGLSWFDDSELSVLDDERSRRILEQRSDMGDGVQHSLSAVGKMLGIGPEWVRQIQNKALFAIRRARLEERARIEPRGPNQSQTPELDRR